MRQAPRRQGQRQSAGAKVRLVGVIRRPRNALLMATALQATTLLVLTTPVLTTPVLAQPATNAQPQGGRVAAGSAVISQSSTLTTITQSSQNAAINWSSFNVGSNQTVDFAQPSSTASTLNRVNSPDPSQIAGRINANGTVVLVNQNGVVFDRGAQVNVGGLMVSAAGISTKAYMAGKVVFNHPGNPNAAVVNNGNITVKQAGLAALVAPQVVNAGAINAHMGHVVLAGAKTATLDLYGDGLVSIDVTNEMTKAPLGPNGQPVAALVTNTGTIRADGGTVQLTARAVDGLVQNLVAAGGTIAANSVGSHTGTVLISGTGGSVVVTGTVTAEGRAPGTTGGAIGVNATDGVALTSTARLDASGQAGGGLIAVGTTLKRAAGGPSVITKKTAKTVTVAQGATIAANAITKGNGGRVTVLSGETTVMNGAILAEGGKHGGNGGFVEISGGRLGMTTGMVDVSAALANPGTILLDPMDLEIVGSGGILDGTFAGTVTTGQDSGSIDTLSASVLDGFTGNVLLQAADVIDVQQPFSIAAGALTMESHGVIQTDAGANISASGDIVLTSGAININANLTSTGGSVSLLTSTGGQIGIAGTVQSASGKSVVLQTDTLNLVGASVVAPSGTIEIAPATTGNGINFASSNSGTLQIPTSALAQLSASVLRLGAVTINNVLTTTAGSITFDTSVNLTGIASTLDLQTTGTAAAINSSVLTVGTLTGNSASFDLSSAGRASIGTVGSYNVGSGNFYLVNTGGLTIAGPVNAGSIFVENADANNLTISGSVSASNSATLKTGGTVIVGTAGTIIGPQTTLYGISGIALNGSALVGQAAGTLDLNAFGSGMNETSNATLVAGTLQSTLNGANSLGGTISLLGTANAIDSLNIGTISGDFLLRDSNALTVGATLSATGNIFLRDTNAGGITISGSMIAGTGKLASLQTDALINTGTVIAAGGTIELAPDTVGSVVNIGTGTGGLQLSQATLNRMSASTLRIGGITFNNTLTQTAGSILIQGAVNLAGIAATLDLQSTGTVTEAASGELDNVATLTGTTGAVSLTQSTNSGLTAIGNYTVTGGGDFDATVTGGTGVSGTLAANNVNLQTIGASSIAVNGTVAATGTVALSSGSIALNGTSNVQGGTITLIGAAGVRVSGAAVLGKAGQTALLDVSTTLGDFTEPTTATINAGTVRSSNGIAGNVRLLGTANSIGSIGSFAITNGDFSLVSTGGLAVGGPLTGATNVSLAAGTIGVGGTISASGTLALAAGGGGIALNTGEVLSGATVDLSASGAGITQVATGTIIASTILQSGSGVTGTADLMGTGNTIAALESFAVTSGDFTLVSTGSLAVLAAVGAGNISLDAGTIGIGGFLNAGTVLALGASAGGITESGSITAATLASNGMIAGGATLTGSNTIASLGTLAVSGGNLSVSDTGSLSVAGLVSAPNIALTAGTIGIPGSVSAGTLLSLGASAGGIHQATTSVINAPTVASIGTVTGGVTLVGTANQIGAFGSFGFTGAFSLNDSVAVTFDGAFGGPSATSASLDAASATIASTGSLDIGTLAVTTTVGGISLVGSITATSAVDLSAAGTINQTGGIITTGTLTGSSVGGASLTQGNAVGTFGGFTNTTSGTLSFTNASSLTTAGTISSAGNIALTTTGSGSNLTLGGDISAPGTSVTLAATGRISQSSGVVTAGTLSTSSAGGATLGEMNHVSNLGPVSNSGTGGVTLVDATALTVGGTVDAGTQALALTALGSLEVNAALTAGTNLSLRGAGIGLDANVTGGATGTLALVSAGAITQSAGSIAVGTLTATTSAAGDVTLASATNQIAASSGISLNNGNLVLVDDPSLVLTGVHSANALFYEVNATGGTLQIGSNSAGATLTAGSAQRISLVADTITAGDASSTLTAPGGVVELAPYSSGATVSLAGNAGNLIAGPVFSDINTGTIVVGRYTDVPNGSTLNVSAGSISVDGLIGLTGHAASLGLFAQGAITESAGTLIVGTLFGNGTSVSLLTQGNEIGTLGTFAASSGDLLLEDMNALAVAGSISATGSVYLQSANGSGIGVSGTVAAGNNDLVSFQAAKFANSGTVTGGTFEFAPNPGGTLDLGTSAGFASLAGIGPTILRIGAVTMPNGVSPTTTAGSLVVGGSFGASGVTLELDSLGGISQSAGSLSAGTLTGNAATSVSLTQAGNLIGTLAAFTSGNGFALTDNEALQVNGPVHDTGAASTVALSTRTGGMTLAGNVTAANALDLISAGGINQSGGSISAATLSGSAEGSVTLGAANQIAVLNGFSVAGGGFSLVDSGNLAISGLLSSSNITVNTRSNQLTLAGASIATNGDARPSGTTFSPSLAPSGGASGALFETGNFVQTGASSVTALAGTRSTLQILSSGNITFSNLAANGTWLILQLPGSGHASGSIAVSALDLDYTSPNGGGSANLNGSIAGITGSAAAGLANILPEPSAFYQFNSCPIHSINCVVLPTLNLPVIPQIATLFFGSPELPSDDPSLIFIMPNVAKQDY